MYPSTYVRNYKGLASLQQLLHSKKRTWKTVVHVYWSQKTGTGKTRFAEEMSGEDAYYFAPQANSYWFDGYNGNRVVVFDDFDGTHIPYRVLLRICDRYPCRVPVKGGYKEFVATKIVFTSNLHPSEWYRHRPGLDMRPLYRRITKIERIEEPIYSDIDEEEWLKDQINL